jgi:hypothetical protein
MGAVALPTTTPSRAKGKDAQDEQEQSPGLWNRDSDRSLRVKIADVPELAGIDTIKVRKVCVGEVIASQVAES